MKKVRTFVAIELPGEVVEHLARLQERLRECGARVKWVQQRNLHLTVKFLGDVEFEKVSEISKVLKEAVTDVAPLRVKVRGAGTFPKGGRSPRIVWAGVEGSREVLEKIYKHLNEKLVKFGAGREKRAWSPHITIGRVKSAAGTQTLVEMIRGLSGMEFGEVEVSELVFFMSELANTGPIYTVLARIPFGAQTPPNQPGM